MKPTHDEPQDELTRAYRAAGDRAAGRPPDAVRAAILANARMEAAKRMPAANDSRFWWRAVAGVAMFGVAVLIWRQVDPNVVRDATVQSPQTELNEVVVGSAPAPAVPQESAVSASREQPREARSLAKAEDSNQAQAYVPVPPAAPAPAPAPAPPIVQMQGGRDQLNALTRARGPERSERAAAAVDVSRTTQDLLEREFPEEFNGATPSARLWVIRDIDGRTLQKGRLGQNEDLAAVTARLLRESGVRLTGEWSTTTVRNAQGLAIELAVVTAAR